MIEFGYKEKEVTVDDVSITYIQDPDTEQNKDDDFQRITLKTVDTGFGPFIRLSIPDNTFWSISDVSEIVQIFEDFNEKVNYRENTWYVAPPKWLIKLILEKYNCHRGKTIDESAESIVKHWNYGKMENLNEVSVGVDEAFVDTKESVTDKSLIIKDFMERKYKINEDGSVDVDDDVDVFESDVIDGKLPFKFGKVSGNFDCSACHLTSLEGCPQEVGGFFNCSHNQLTSLEGCPREVGGSFSCNKNQLTSLEGCPQKIVGDFDCRNNQLTSLKGCPKEVSGCFNCDNNQLTSLKDCPQEVGGCFTCSCNNKQFTKADVKSACENIGGELYR